jgi:hypothetical protein
LTEWDSGLDFLGRSEFLDEGSPHTVRQVRTASQTDGFGKNPSCAITVRVPRAVRGRFDLRQR